MEYAATVRQGTWVLDGISPAAAATRKRRGMAMAGPGDEDLRRVVDMLSSERMEKQFRLLRASTLLAELRSAVSLVQTHDSVSSSSLKLIFCVRSLASPLRDLLEAVVQQAEVRAAEEWRQVPAVLYRYLVFRSATIRDLRQFLRKFRSLGTYMQQEHHPRPRHVLGSGSSSSLSLYSTAALARNREGLREPMVGRSELLEKMVAALLSDRTGYRALLLMPIVGGPGVGKTRIAKAILDDGRIKHRFPVRLVVPVAQDSCLERILMLMVPPELRLRADANYSLETMAMHIDRKLSGGSYLVVLDDVWSDNEGRWQEIGTVVNTMPSNGVVVLTTRTPHIASKLATMADNIPYTIKPFYLHPLGQEFSSSFVGRWVATCHGDWHADELVRKIGAKIAAKCCGVPLLLDSARRVFCRPLDLQFWQALLLQDDTGGIHRHPDMFKQELLDIVILTVILLYRVRTCTR